MLCSEREDGGKKLPHCPTFYFFCCCVRNLFGKQPHVRTFAAAADDDTMHPNLFYCATPTPTKSRH